MKNKLYFASPFFNEEQIEREERLKKKLRQLSFRVFSPKESLLCKPDASDEERQRTFEGNCEAIKNSDIIFVVTDGKDIGTIWEAGYANGINEFYRSLYGEEKIKIAYYCETLPKDGQFNLMLAQSADIVITDFEDIKMLPIYLRNGEKRKYVGKIE